MENKESDKWFTSPDVEDGYEHEVAVYPKSFEWGADGAFLNCYKLDGTTGCTYSVKWNSQAYNFFLENFVNDKEQIIITLRKVGSSCMCVKARRGNQDKKNMTLEIVNTSLEDEPQRIAFKDFMCRKFHVKSVNDLYMTTSEYCLWMDCWESAIAWEDHRILNYQLGIKNEKKAD